MKRLMRVNGETLANGAGKRRLWVILSVALLALMALGGPVSAASPEERTKPQPGVLITAVGEEMPAAEAGLARGDILLAIDGDMVNTAAELQKVILMQDPGDTLELTVKRGEEELTLTVTLADRDGYPLLGVAAHVPQDEYMAPQRGHSNRMKGFGRFFGMEHGKGLNASPFGAGDGVAVMEALEDAPAAAADVQAGDVITALGDTEIAAFDDLAQAVAAHSPGDEVALAVDRDGETITLTVTLGAHPDDEEKAYLGVRILPAGQFRLHMDGSGPDGGDRRWNRFGFGFPQGQPSDGRFMPMMTDGALIIGVQDDGPAANAELAMGDVINAVDEIAITGLEELVAALANYNPGNEVELTVDRDGESVAIAVTLGAHPNDETKAYLGVMIMPVERIKMELQDDGEQAHEETQPQNESERDS